MSIPSSLSQFVLRKVKLALAAGPDLKQVSETDREKAARSLVDTLAILHPTDNKVFSESGAKLAKAIGAISLTASSLINIDSSILNDWLCRYDEYLNNNHSIFESIISHHTNISSEDWSNVVENAGALSEYSSAAASMGSKKWVVECNQWMETFALNYFRHGGARKYYIKQQRMQFKAVERAKADIDAENTEFAKLQSDLLSSGTAFSKMRLLDVGSCYNPFKHSDNASQLDVTALDLYPSDPSVYQCDFLGLQIGAAGTAPVIVEPSAETANTSEPDAKRQKISAENRPSEVCHSKGTSLCLQQLPASAYDVIVMSLVLNYLPTSEQRLKMICNARALLVSPQSATTNKAEENNGDNVWPPHRNGLLLIAEKQSIFKSPASNNNVKYMKSAKLTANNATGTKENGCDSSAGIDLYSNWIRAICGCGFELVKYHFLHTSDGRKSHLFAFATVPMDSVVVDSSLKLSIKQDFDIHK